MRIARISYNLPVQTGSANLQTWHTKPMGHDSVSFQKSGDAIREEYFQFKEGSGATADIFQRSAAQHIQKGNDTLITAPTGTGKTAIALYAITNAVEQRKKAYYTAPLKALSNEKYRDFQKIFGPENVGLLTGDVKENTQAPILLMTTEIYRNMTANQNVPRDVGTVVFDELHYLGDVDRGGVWEQSIMFTPQDVQLVSLSATIGNNQEITKWMSKIRGRDVKLVDVPTANRHVPLHFSDEPVTLNEQNKVSIESYVKLTEQLKEKDQLPAIYFIFSKKGSRQVLDGLKTAGPVLTSETEKAQIAEILKEYEDKGIYLGETLNKKALKKGYAIHNAGMLPAQKQLIETLFQKKLIKVVIATETLSAGINMPARTTVISSIEKPASVGDGKVEKRCLTPNEFHQMAGRAGRRGIDKEGFCITLSPDRETQNAFADLKNSPPNWLNSAFRIDYAFAAANSTNENLEQMLDRSFWAFNKGSDQLLDDFDEKIAYLKEHDYVNADNSLTNKGQLLTRLHGYPNQIDIIDAVYNKKLPVDDTKKQVEKFTQMVAEFANTEFFVDDASCNVANWAMINNQGIDDPADNWRYLIELAKKNEVFTDEGSLFKDIMRTIDLLKQLQTIAQTGQELFANDWSNVGYYFNLGKMSKAALQLLSQPPIVM